MRMLNARTARRVDSSVLRALRLRHHRQRFRFRCDRFYVAIHKCNATQNYRISIAETRDRNSARVCTKIQVSLHCRNVLYAYFLCFQPTQSRALAREGGESEGRFNHNPPSIFVEHSSSSLLCLRSTPPSTCTRIRNATLIRTYALCSVDVLGQTRPVRHQQHNATRIPPHCAHVRRMPSNSRRVHALDEHISSSSSEPTLPRSSLPRRFAFPPLSIASESGVLLCWGGLLWFQVVKRK